MKTSTTPDRTWTGRVRPDRTGGLPRWVTAAAALALTLLLTPLIGLLTEVPWPDLTGLITTGPALDALWLSLRTATASTALCILLGTPLALVLARRSGALTKLLRAFVLLPLVLPPVVAGMALLTTFGRHGLLGAHLTAWGIPIAFSTTAVVIAQTFVSLPFLVVALEGGLRAMGRDYDDVAASLGANPTTVLRRVTIPLVLPALGSGAALAFARCLGEFGATLTFAGSLQGVTRTLPLEIYLSRETDPAIAIALSVLLIAVAAIIVLATRLIPTPKPEGTKQ